MTGLDMDCWRYIAEAVRILDEKTPIEQRLQAIVRCNLAPQRNPSWKWCSWSSRRGRKHLGESEFMPAWYCLFCGEYFEGEISKHAATHRPHWLERMPHVVQIAWDRERGISGVPTNLEFRR
jgi:hypothetical protein